MEITVMAFGQLAELTGANFTIHDITDTNGLTEYLHSNFPGTSHIHYKIAVNKKIISANTLIEKNTIIALLPPFSGG